VLSIKKALVADQLVVTVSEQALFQELVSKFNKRFNDRTGLNLDPAVLHGVRFFFIINYLSKVRFNYAKT
jgi:hypothetical protein